MRPEERIASLLTEKKMTVALAESVTGGLASHKITNVPGSSRYFLGSVVAYSNASKVALLGLREETIKRHGAVSSQAVLEMAAGVRTVLGSDIGAAVTGIAGPAGATPGKPIGLIYFAVDDGRASRTEREVFSGSREDIKNSGAERLLQLIADHLARLP